MQYTLTSVLTFSHVFTCTSLQLKTLDRIDLKREYFAHFPTLSDIDLRLVTLPCSSCLLALFSITSI